MTLKESTVDVISFSATISACERGGEWERALQLLHSMHTTYGIAPNLIAFNATLAACAAAAAQHAGARYGAWHVLRMLHEHSTVEADVMSYNTCLRTCEGWAQVVEMLNTMRARRVSPDALTFIEALNAMRVKEGEQLDVSPMREKWDASSIHRTREDALQEVIHAARQGVMRWMHTSRADSSFIRTPYEAIQLLQAFYAVPPSSKRMDGGEERERELSAKEIEDRFCETVRHWVFDRTVTALRQGHMDSLQRFAVPNLGPFTKDAFRAWVSIFLPCSCAASRGRSGIEG